MRKLLTLVVLLGLFTGCSKGYNLINKATEKVKTSVSVCTEKIGKESAEKIKSACEEAISAGEISTSEAHTGAWDTNMLLW